MEQQEEVRLHAGWYRFCLIVATLVFTGGPPFSQAQAPGKSTYDGRIYPRKNTFGIIGAYAWDSHRILLGDSERRMLLDFGVAYSRRILLTRAVNWQYDAEILPVALESDPLTLYVDSQTSPTVSTTESIGTPSVLCSPTVFTYTFTDPGGVTYSGTETITCQGRQWTVGEAMSPIGMRLNLLPHRRMQPFVDGHGGYIYTTRPIPVPFAGSFNFTFDFGAGLEIYRKGTQSIRAEYRFHHISNKDTATQNPGIDNGLLQVTYCFGFGRQ